MNLIRTFVLSAAFALLSTAPPAWGSETAAATLDPTFNPNFGEGFVLGTVVQPDGKMIVCGMFTTMGAEARTNLVRLNTDGSVDTSFTANTDRAVSSVAIQADGKIVVAGSFTMVNGTSRTSIARLDAKGTVESTESFTGGTGVNGSVNTIVVQADGKIILGGTFTMFNGKEHNRIVRLHPNGDLESADTFNPGTGPDLPVKSMALQADGKIVLGGEFGRIDGTSCYRIARLKSDGSLDTGAFKTGDGADGVVNSVAVQADQKIVLGGFFSKFNGTLRNNIARLNADGSVDDSLRIFNSDFSITGTNGPVTSVTVQADGKIVLGGGFTKVANAGRTTRIARLNPNGSVDSTFNNLSDPGTGANNDVGCVAVQADGKIVLGGSFTTFNNTSRKLIARLNNYAPLQTLTMPDSSHVQWNRGGGGPEISYVTFDHRPDRASAWKPLGTGSRIPGTSNWNCPISPSPSSEIRVRGYTPVTPLPEQWTFFGALNVLEQGNRRYVEGPAGHPDQSAAKRVEVATGQYPFAVIVGCSDSRVPPEVVFDQGLGDLFPIRIAGEVVDNSALGSIEYAVEHLHTPLIVVLGHEKCGAVAAAVDAVVHHGHYEEHILTLVNAIKPAVDHAQGEEGDLLENSVKENAREIAKKLGESEPVIKEAVEAGTVSIVTGYYDLDTGKVIFYK